MGLGNARPVGRRATLPTVLACCLLVAGCRQGAKVESGDGSPAKLTAMTAELAGKAAAVAQAGRAIRLAIVTFTPTQSEYAEKNDFGVFFTEELTSELKKHGTSVRLFERSRLEVITRENALTLSGLIDAAQAAQIGQLAPIDYILTGTYTRLANQVGVNARMLDVVSGEIVFSHNLKVALSENLAGLFTGVPAAAVVPGAAAAPSGPVDTCAPAKETVTALLRDLSTPEKVREAVAGVVKIPFDTACGRAHYEVLGTFARHRIFDPTYDRFLTTTLAGVQDPSEDHRVREILYYWHKAGPLLPDEKFRAGLDAVRKIGNSWLNVYFGYLFHTDSITDAQRQKQIERLNTILELAQSGKLGLPVPVSFDMAFLELVGGLNAYSSRADNRLILHCYEKWGDKLTPSKANEHRKIFLSMYGRETDKQTAGRILALICDSFNKAQSDERLAAALFDFARDLVDKAEHKDTPAALKPMYREHFKTFTGVCGKQIAETFPRMPQDSRRKALILFCLEHGIPAPALVPTLDSLTVQLFDENSYRQRDAAELIQAMGAKAAPAEAKVAKLLRRAEHMQGSGTTNLRWALISTLGNIKTTNPEALDLLFGALESLDYCVPDSAIAALARIGKPIVPRLKKHYEGKEPSLQIRLAKVYGHMGPEARSELPYLKKLLAQATNVHVRDALEDVIDKVSGER